MTDDNERNTTERFTGLADTYAKFRPDYPQSAIQYIIDTAQLQPESTLADIGSGTGISTRIMSEQGFRVWGVEPNDEMRACAESGLPAKSESGPRYFKGTAEATTLPNGCVELVLSAQAFHWFATEKALAEFLRILKPGGWVILMWNERDEEDDMTRVVGDIIRSFPEADSVEKNRTQCGELLLTSEYFEQGHKKIFSHEQKVNEEGLIGRALSASYAPKDPNEIECCKQQLREIFRRFRKNDSVKLCYKTSLYCAQSRSVI